VEEPIWRRIVGDTITAGSAPDLAIWAWLREQEAAVARGELSSRSPAS
jgi:hypothetical protein